MVVSVGTAGGGARAPGCVGAPRTTVVLVLLVMEIAGLGDCPGGAELAYCLEAAAAGFDAGGLRDCVCMPR